MRVRVRVESRVRVRVGSSVRVGCLLVVERERVSIVTLTLGS